MAMISFYFSSILPLPEHQYCETKLCSSVSLMHDHYHSPTGRSKLLHHAVSAVRPITVRLMNCCHATLAIILFYVLLFLPSSTALKLFTSFFLLYKIQLIIDQ